LLKIKELGDNKRSILKEIPKIDHGIEKFFKNILPM
jgi:hypothetical protein